MGYYEPEEDDDTQPELTGAIDAATASKDGVLTVQFASQQAIIDALAASMMKLAYGEESLGEIRRLAAQKAREQIESAARAAAREVAPEVIKEVAGNTIRGEVQRMIETGFIETDSWGSPKKTVSFAARISSLLFGDGNYNNKGIVDNVVHQAVTSLLDREVSGLIADAKKRISAALDAKVTEKIASAIRDAIGLRV